MEGASPARLYATLIGATLVVAGIIGFFYNASFHVGSGLEADNVLGILAVNGWHNLVHILSGVFLLAFAGGPVVRKAVLAFGFAYILIFILGILQVGAGDTDSILKLIPINTADDVLHLILGLLAVAAALTTPQERLHRTPTT